LEQCSKGIGKEYASMEACRTQRKKSKVLSPLAFDYSLWGVKKRPKILQKTLFSRCFLKKRL
jgi:hypothetical protein